MTAAQTTLLVMLALTVVAFLSGRWRHDVVALAALLGCVFLGLVQPEQAFAGFGHPAVITVASVLVLSRGLQTTGAVDLVADRLMPDAAGPTVTIAVITGLGAAISSVMNNVGAMALLMPVAIQISQRLELPPGKILMPLAFGTILGGMTTLIGTPPNLIVSGFRAETAAGTFGMFDFAPVGLAVAITGVIFVALLGWRLVPAREHGGVSGFDTGTYLTEARVNEDSKLAGQSLREVENELEQADAQIVGLVRNEIRLSAPNPRRRLKPGDILVIEAEPESLGAILAGLGLTLEPEQADDASKHSKSGSKQKANQDQDKVQPENAESEQDPDPEESILQELAVMPTSTLVGRSAAGLRMRTRYGLSLLAVSRQGRRSIKRLRAISIGAGDVLLILGSPEALSGFAAEYGCVPLAQRALRLPARRQAFQASAIMLLAIAGAAFGLVPAAISFAAGVLLFMVLRILPARQIYEGIDWPVVVLLAALIPVAGAMAETGAADLLAQAMLNQIAGDSAIVALALILILTMTLSDFMNNAATAAVMCPVAISVAGQLGVNADTFLMAVAIGASCAFLTPIGHQNNTLILGPGGFRFGDYWRLGLPMEILVVGVSLPMLLLVWPL